jgi:hypothetical protein
MLRLWQSCEAREVGKKKKFFELVTEIRRGNDSDDDEGMEERE